jgi:DNA polymerase elongation subunit (family B)
LPSKTHFGVPVLNRFYGVFDDGKIKARGIEVRRRDTPNIVTCFQNEMLEELAKATNSEEFFLQIPNVFHALRRYADKILKGKVDLDDLVISKQISKNPEGYVSNVHQAIAARQLLDHGMDVTAGQTVKYVISDADNRRPERRVMAVQLMEPSTKYDKEKYLKLLNESLYNLLPPSIHNLFSLKSGFLAAY